MLTQKQIDLHQQTYDCGREEDDDSTYCDCPMMRSICNQAKQAIDLTAKLAAIKALCEESRKTGRRLSYLDVLDAIKEGDT